MKPHTKEILLAHWQAGAEEQPEIAQPQVVQPNIRPVANFQVTTPKKFSYKPEEGPKWIKRFERFRNATGLDKSSKHMNLNNEQISGRYLHLIQIHHRTREL